MSEVGNFLNLFRTQSKLQHFTNYLVKKTLYVLESIKLIEILENMFFDKIIVHGTKPILGDWRNNIKTPQTMQH